MRVKHFRLETDDPSGTGSRRYLLALIPINFGRLADNRAVEAAISTEGHYMLAIDDDAYIEADPYGWIGKDWDLVYAHFYLREKVQDLRGGQVLKASEVRKSVDAVVRRLISEREVLRANGATSTDETSSSKKANRA